MGAGQIAAERVRQVVTPAGDWRDPGGPQSGWFLLKAGKEVLWRTGEDPRPGATREVRGSAL